MRQPRLFVRGVYAESKEGEMMMEGLMREDEVVKRLAAGEDAIDLSIEKWKRVRAYMATGKPLPVGAHVSSKTSHVSSKTCALCICYNEECSECPLTPGCNETESAWRRVVVDKTIEAVDAMIEVLERCRTCNNP